MFEGLPDYLSLVDPNQIRDISSEVLDADGRMKVLPAKYWATTTAEERQLFGHHHGLYSFPTTELVDYLKGLIGDRTAIEIGAGNGVLSEALDIIATDNRQQEMSEWRAHYRRIQQPIVQYGPNIVEREASKAIRKYKPQVVIGCWVTHKYDRRRHSAGGNKIGIDEFFVLANCDTYVMVGNEIVHKGKSIWNQPHSIIYPDWVYSRANNGTRDFIAEWSK
jgi:hypothetical protein